jgi:FdhE protein
VRGQELDQVGFGWGLVSEISFSETSLFFCLALALSIQRPCRECRPGMHRQMRLCLFLLFVYSCGIVSQERKQKEDPLDRLKERIEQIEKKRPFYREILDFYRKVREEQMKIRLSLKADSILSENDLKDLLAKEGFPLLPREKFPLDMEACMRLFQSLCQIGKDANPHLSQQAQKIQAAVEGKSLDLNEVLKEGLKNQKERIDQISEELELDKKVLVFLVENSLEPFAGEAMELVSKNLGPETGLKGICPICGALPSLSLLGEEVGKRSLICSFCRYQWPIERLFCPFCNNREQGSLHYFYAEDEESSRVDVCEKCHQYIKTFDLRQVEGCDPFLEDLATLHLDLLASQKGYQRPVPTFWLT